MRLEQKTLPLANAGLELKANDGEPVVVSGLASVFNGVDSYNDTILPGAYQKTIGAWSARQWPMPMLMNHSPSDLIGRWTEMREDDRGLVVTGELTPGHSKAADAISSLRHQALTGLSIGFRAVAADMEKDGRRLLREIDLYEVSLVTMPADHFARVSSVKSVSTEIHTIRDLETLLRDELGWSRREAEAVTNRVFKSVAPARDERVSAGGFEAAVVAEMRAASAANQRRDVEGDQASKLLALLRECRLTPA